MPCYPSYLKRCRCQFSCIANALCRRRALLEPCHSMTSPETVHVRRVVDLLLPAKATMQI